MGWDCFVVLFSERLRLVYRLVDALPAILFRFFPISSLSRTEPDVNFNRKGLKVKVNGSSDSLRCYSPSPFDLNRTNFPGQLLSRVDAGGVDAGVADEL